MVKIEVDCRGTFKVVNGLHITYYKNAAAFTKSVTKGLTITELAETITSLNQELANRTKAIVKTVQKESES